MHAEVGRLSPNDVEGHERFLKASEAIHRVGFEQLGDVPFDAWTDMVKVAPDLIRLEGYRTVWSLACKHVKSPKLRVVLTFQSPLVGGNPFATTSVYCLIACLERRWGVHFPIGGTGALASGLVGLIEGHGGSVQWSRGVAQISVEHGLAGNGVTRARAKGRAARKRRARRGRRGGLERRLGLDLQAPARTRTPQAPDGDGCAQPSRAGAGVRSGRGDATLEHRARRGRRRTRRPRLSAAGVAALSRRRCRSVARRTGIRRAHRCRRAARAGRGRAALRRASTPAWRRCRIVSSRHQRGAVEPLWTASSGNAGTKALAGARRRFMKAHG